MRTSLVEMLEFSPSSFREVTYQERCARNAAECREKDRFRKEIEARKAALKARRWETIRQQAHRGKKAAKKNLTESKRAGSDYLRDYQLIWHFLDKYGEFHPVQYLSRKVISRGRPRKCFSNAYSFANQNPHVHYIEGMAGAAYERAFRCTEVGTLHAWVRIEPHGKLFDLGGDRYCDVTWSQYGLTQPTFHFGVEFDLGFVAMVQHMQVQEAAGKPNAGGFSVLTYLPLLLGEIPEERWRPKSWFEDR